MSNYKKLGGKKLSPVRRSSVAMAHSLRGGAGAGLHRDKSKYTRKSKHKKRLNPGPPAGMPEAKWLSSINTMKEDIRANLGAAIKKAQEKHGIFTKTRPNGEKYEDSSPWPIAQGRLGLIMASSPHAALAEDALIFEDSGEVRPAANIVNSIMSPVFGDALKDEEVRDLYDMGVSALTEKIDMLRAPAIEVITSGEAALEEDEAEEDEEMLKARLIAKAKAAGEEELAEGIKRGLIEIEDAEEMLAGVEEEEVAGGEPEAKTEPTPQKSGARAPRTPRTETQQKRGQERAERSASSLRVGKEKQTIPDEPTRARGVPLELERFIVHRRDIAAGPSADILNRVRSDVLLWALDNGHTQVWAKGSCIATFEASGSGKSSPQIAAQYAAEWRRGKKSRYSARIWVGVQGNSDIVMKADSLEAAARKAAPVGTPEQVAESIKVNPRYRHNAKMERVWGGVRFNVGYLSADALRRTARREREAEELALLEAESAMREADRRRQRGLTRKIKPVLSRAYLEAKGMPRRNPGEPMKWVRYHDDRDEGYVLDPEGEIFSLTMPGVGTVEMFKTERSRYMGKATPAFWTVDLYYDDGVRPTRRETANNFATAQRLAKKMLSTRPNPFDLKGIFGSAKKHGENAARLAKVAATKAQIAAERSRYRDAYNTLDMTYTEIVEAARRGDKRAEEAEEAVLADVLGLDAGWKGNRKAVLSRLKAGKAGIFGLEAQLRELEQRKNPRRRNPAEYPGITLIWRPTPGMQGESKFFPAYTDIRESVVMAEYREAAEAALKTVRANKHFPEIEVTLASGLAIKKDLPWLEQSAKYGVRSTVQASQTTSAIRKAVGLRENPKASLPSISGRMPKPYQTRLPSIYIPVNAPKKRKK
jgi:hypothetical protein